MEKKSIFKKIDELYTKVTKVIIGDIPHDGESQDISSQDKKSTPSQNQESNVQSTLLIVKEKILNLGKPNDEKALLYTEVVKREKQEAKESTKKSREVKKVTKTVTDSKATASLTTKKTLSKKVPTKKTVTTKKETSKKTPSKKTKNTTTTTEKTTKKPVSPKKSSTQKTVAKKETKVETDKKTAATKKTALAKKPSSTKKTATKKAPETKSKSTASKAKKTVTKKKTTSSKLTTKTTATSTQAKSAPRGAKKAAKIALYIKDIKKHYGEVDEAFVAIIVKNLGPSIYKKDAELVSCSDPKELDTVRKNFLMKKLGIDASKGVLDAAIQDVCQELKSTRTKYRATFYYALAKKFKKESVLS